jgi:hypothetical protein
MNDDKVDRYLFDPTAPPADEVQELEELLAPLRYDAEAKPLKVVSFRRRFRPLLAVAASLVLVAAGLAAWVWTWPSERPWNVVSGSIDALRVGQTVQASDPLRVRVARIGWMDVKKGSVFTLNSTRSNKHRLAMTEGTIHVSVWAPPTSIAFMTPSGEVIDFGCEFILDVDKETSRVDVVSGWVQLSNDAGEVLVPGGAVSEMTPSGVPTVPVFKTADPAFQEAVRSRDVDTLVRTARRRDVLTLLHLARRGIGRDRLVTRAAELMPPRSPETVAAARRGEAEAYWTWVGELPLPPAKSWVRNWRDWLLSR